MPTPQNIQRAFFGSTQWFIRRRFLIDAFVVLALLIVFALTYIPQMAWGSWGDDSPGYIYTAGQIYKGEDLVVQDALVQEGLMTFGNEKQARFLAPTHHTILSPDGWVASKYPIGLPGLLAFTGKIIDAFGYDGLTYMYILNPLLAVLVIILTYLVCIVWLPFGYIYNRSIGIISAISLGLIDLFSSYAVSQPMRDIPSTAFLLVAFLALGVLRLYKERNPQLKRSMDHIVSYLTVVLFAVSLGIAVNVRETSIVVVTVLCFAFWYVTRGELAARLRFIAMSVFILALLPLILSSIDINVHRAAFDDQAKTSIELTSNFDHIESLSISNIFNNQGKFRPGIGGAKQYSDVMKDFSLWPAFMLSAFIGFIVLYRSKRRDFALISLAWFTVVFLLFAMWINPYARYIMPLIPIVAIFSASGVVMGLVVVQRWFNLSYVSAAALTLVVFASLFAAWRPMLTTEQSDILNRTLTNKAISSADLAEIISLPEVLGADSNTIIYMQGQWKAGISEMIMTHADIRVIREPSPAAQKPPLHDLAEFLQRLANEQTVYLWYDNSANEDEAALRELLSLEPASKLQFTFQSDVELLRVLPTNQ